MKALLDLFRSRCSELKHRPATTQQTRLFAFLGGPESSGSKEVQEVAQVGGPSLDAVGEGPILALLTVLGGV